MLVTWFEFYPSQFKIRSLLYGCSRSRNRVDLGMKEEEKWRTKRWICFKRRKKSEADWQQKTGPRNHKLTWSLTSGANLLFLFLSGAAAICCCCLWAARTDGGTYLPPEEGGVAWKQEYIMRTRNNVQMVAHIYRLKIGMNHEVQEQCILLKFFCQFPFIKNSKVFFLLHLP